MLKQNLHRWITSPLFSPLQATNEVIYRVPKATQEEMLAAVDSCSRAYQSWSETSILARQQLFLRYQQLIKDNIVRQRFRKFKVQTVQLHSFKLELTDMFNLLEHYPPLTNTHTHVVVTWPQKKQDKFLDSCFRKNWPSPSHMNRERPLQMQRGTCSEDCVSFSPPRVHAELVKSLVNVCKLV